jgi:hypothetical protein
MGRVMEQRVLEKRRAIAKMRRCIMRKGNLRRRN